MTAAGQAFGLAQAAPSIIHTSDALLPALAANTCTVMPN